MEDILSQLEKHDAQAVKKVFTDLMRAYLTPAYGSMSKRDFDILLFIKLQEMGVFQKNPELYDLVSSLRVTRAKARNLLYESKLRQTSPAELDQELILLLQKPVFLKDHDKIGIEVDNPFLIDHLRARLKQLNYLTDGSFSPELVKLSTDAFVALFDYYLPEESKTHIKASFIAIGAATDTSLKALLKGAFKKLGARVASDAGAMAAGQISDFLEPMITGSLEAIKTKIGELYGDQND